MLINYFECKFENCNECNMGSEENPDYEWIYGCTNPNNHTAYCNLDNKYCGENDDCKLLDIF